MAVFNPEHLIDQAELLLSPRDGRKPRQADLRRAISVCYYAVFHHVLTAASDEFVNKALRSDQRYGLVYRSIDHRTVKGLCGEASRQNPSPKYRRFFPEGGFEQKIRDFSNIFIRLQVSRHEADYDPMAYFSSKDALVSVSLARSAINQFTTTSEESRKLFLTLLLFQPR